MAYMGRLHLLDRNSIYTLERYSAVYIPNAINADTYDTPP
jgi:hypothetical protein